MGRIYFKLSLFNQDFIEEKIEILLLVIEKISLMLPIIKKLIALQEKKDKIYEEMYYYIIMKIPHMFSFETTLKDLNKFSTFLLIIINNDIEKLANNIFN